MKKTIFSIVLASLLIPGAIFAAQSAPSVASFSSNPIFIPSASGPVPSCPTIFQDLKVGSVDVSANGNVSALQDVLVGKGFLTFPFGVAKGYFGNLTKRALASYQTSVGIYPAVGYFGPITRARLQSFFCGGINQNISISSVAPSSGPVGAQVSLYGSGFSSSKNVIRFGSGTILNATYSEIMPMCANPGVGIVVSSDYCRSQQVLTFNVPTSLESGCRLSTPPCGLMSILTTPGDYLISVSNDKGEGSNTVKFTVTSSDGKAPIINGVKAPTSLQPNQKGTWTVEATDPQNGSLKYSVDWGDISDYCLYNTSIRPCAPSLSASAVDRMPVYQQSASFTHSYSQVGTYTQTFTVTNDSGGQAETTTTVQVNSLSTNSGPTLSRLSSNSGPIGTTVTIYGSRFTSTGNQINFSGGEYYYLSNLSSSNGTTLTFNIPSASDPACAHSYPVCYIMSVQTYPGDHSISVTNANGTSNSLNFMVTNSQANTNTMSIEAFPVTPCEMGSTCRTMQYFAYYPVSGWNANPHDNSVYTIDYGDGITGTMTYSGIQCPVDGGGSCRASWATSNHTMAPGNYNAILYRNGTQITNYSFIVY